MKTMEFFGDPLKISLYVGVALVIAGAVFLAAVVWSNNGSRNLVLAASTLVGAFVMFVIQLPLELKEKVGKEYTRVELMIDRAKHEIRQQRYLPVGGWRIHQETGASSFLAQSDRSQFDGSLGHREQLTRDMAVFSLVSYLGAEQFDWRYKPVSLQGQTMGRVEAERIADSDECTLIASQQIQEKLVASGNLFAKAPMLVRGHRLCLPPRSSLNISRDKVEMVTPFCTVSFESMPTGAVNFVSPLNSQEASVTLMENGESRFETRLITIHAVVTYSWIRAQHQEMDQYKDWSSRVVEGARNWFESN
jgi:hypothetical protein